MRVLIKISDKCRELYADYDIIIRPVLKFALAVLTFLLINHELGYLSTLNNLFILIVLAVICAILPLNGMVLIGVLLIVAHCFGLGIEVGAFAAVLYLLMVLLYFRFVPKDALAILMTPVAFACGVPAAVPMSLGQVRGPVSAFSVAFGVLSWQFVKSVPATIEPLKSAPDSSLLDVLQSLPRSLLTEETVFQIIIMVVAVLVVTSIRRLDSDYSHEKAIISGAVVYLVLQIAGSRILDVNIEIPKVILGTVLSLVIAFILKQFYYQPDYESSEQLLFEDDRHYYRVKVIPKLRQIDSETKEPLGKENDEEVPDVDVKRFREIREEEMETKFKTIDIQSELENSLEELRPERK